MAEQGADGIDDLQTQANAIAMASHLKLPLVKHSRLVEALLGASPSPGGYNMNKQQENEQASRASKRAMAEADDRQNTRPADAVERDTLSVNRPSRLKRERPN